MKMTFEQIAKIAKRHDLHIGMVQPPAGWNLIENEDGTISLTCPDTLTSYGEKMVNFAHDIAALAENGLTK